MKSVLKIIFLPLAAIRLILVILFTVILGTTGRLKYLFFGINHNQQKKLLQLWGKSILIICGLHVLKNNIPASGRFILMSNHRSYLDIFILAANCPAAFVAKAEVRSWPLMKTASLLTNIIFVSRQELKSMVAAMERIRALVQAGFPVALYPEGTTSKGPLTLPFKKGSFKIAAEVGIPVIPAAIHYVDVNDAWIGDDTFVGHFFRQMGKPVTRARLAMGAPVFNDDYKALRLEVQHQINAMLQQME